MDPVETVRTFHRRLTEERRIDESLLAKKPGFVHRWGFRTQMRMRHEDHSLVEEDGHRAKVAYRIRGSGYAALLVRQDGTWRIRKWEMLVQPAHGDALDPGAHLD